VTAALISLSALSLALATLLAWLVYRHVQLVESLSPMTLDRDQARAELAQRTEELAIATARIGTLDTALALARKEITHARIQTIVDAEPGDVGAALDRMLDAERAARAAAADRRPAAPAAVPGPRAAPAEPEPAWLRDGRAG
jgi:hypothetical protein